MPHRVKTPYTAAHLDGPEVTETSNLAEMLLWLDGRLKGWEWSNGPAPIVTLATAPSASSAQPATLGTVTPGFGSDALSVTLTSDADFATGSTVTLSSGKLIYTPGAITAANAGTDTLKYTVTDTVTGAVVQETQNVTLVAATGGTIPPVTIGSGPQSFVLNMSEDAYQGDAQFTVSIDGKTPSAPQSVTALHSAGASQAFNLGVLAAGSHDIAVSFINDKSGATSSMDRNLYVTGISVNGTVAPNSTASLFGNSTDHFTINVPH